MCLLALLLVPRPTPAALFQGLGDLPGGTFSSAAFGVSADGQVVVGHSSSTSGFQAFRWTFTNGMVGLGDLPGGNFSSSASAVSADGSVIVGNSSSSNGMQAYRWTQSTGMIGLGDLPGGTFYSVASAVSANGQTIVGESRSELSGTRREAFRWTPADGMVPLGDLPGGNYDSIAYGVSADGSIIVGYSGSSNAASGVAEAFRWTQATGIVGLGDLPTGIFNSIAYGISADGRVVFGRGYSDVLGSSVHEAFRWTAESNLLALGFIPCSDWSIAKASSADGSIIVGDPESGQGDCAFIWDARHGMRNLHEVLTNDYRLNLSGWQLSAARGISADGNTIVGNGRNPGGQTEAWVATGLKPTLTIRHTNQVCSLSWPASAADFALQASDDFSSGWSNIVASIITNASSLTVTQPLSAPVQFYRLMR